MVGSLRFPMYLRVCALAYVATEPVQQDLFNNKIIIIMYIISNKIYIVMFINYY